MMWGHDAGYTLFNFNYIIKLFIGDNVPDVIITLWGFWDIINCMAVDGSKQ